MILRLLYAAAALAALPSAALPELPQRTNRDARALVEFSERMRRYAELRASAESKLPKFADRNDAAAVVAHQEVLAAKIRAARAGARPGDLIRPEAALPMRRMLAQVLEGPDGAQVRAVLSEDSPSKLFLNVNTSYPVAEPLGTVPPRLLRDLPRLPEDIEYRFIGRTLILRDARANLILDLLPKALP